MPWSAVAAVGSAVVGGYVSNKASKKAADAQQQAIDASAYQGEIATDQYEEYKKTYQPLERDFVADARNADSEENYAKAAGNAQATVNSQLSAARERLARTPGLDPSSAAAQAASADLELKGAAIGATAQNTARKNVADTAYAKQQDALALGKGMVSNATSGLAAATASSTSLANSISNQAGSTAAGVGSAIKGITDGIGKADWSKLSGIFG